LNWRFEATVRQFQERSRHALGASFDDEHVHRAASESLRFAPFPFALIRATKNTEFKSTIGVIKASLRLCSFVKSCPEDVDVTSDIRALAPDAVGNDGEPIPPNRSQQRC
jgi:hypothetical protein